MCTYFWGEETVSAAAAAADPRCIHFIIIIVVRGWLCWWWCASISCFLEPMTLCKTDIFHFGWFSTTLSKPRRTQALFVPAVHCWWLADVELILLLEGSINFRESGPDLSQMMPLSKHTCGTHLVHPCSKGAMKWIIGWNLFHKWNFLSQMSCNWRNG